MLYLDRPIGPLRGLQIYRDHADLNQFYFVPERPRLALNDGEPEFIFLKYARDITDNPNFDPKMKESLGGGLLAFTVDLSVDDDILAEVKGELSQFSGGGPIALSPIPFEDGEVRLSILKQGDNSETTLTGTGSLKIFEETWGATKPSIFGNNRATFGIALSQEGATLMEAALKQGISLIGVVYDLKFLGMRPAFNVKVTADYHRIYNHFEAELGATGTIQAVSLAADIGVGFQKLEDDGAIKVEVTQFTDDTDLKRQAEEATRWAREKITEDLFKSSLTPPSFMTRQRQDPLSALMNAFSAGLGGAVGSVLPNPRVPATVGGSSGSGSSGSGSSGSGSTGSGTGSGSGTGTTTGTGTTGSTTGSTTGTGSGTGTATGNSANGSSNGTGSSTGEGGSARLASPNNHVENPASQQSSSNGTSDGGGGASSIAPFRVAFSLRYYRQEELKHRVFEYSMQAAEKRTACPQGLFTTVIEGKDLSDRIVFVNLDDPEFQRLVADVGVVCDWDHDGVDLVKISLEYPGDLAAHQQPSHIDGYTFSPTDTDREVFNSWLNAQKDMSYRYQADVHFKSNSPWVGRDSVLHGNWQTTRDRQLVFNPLDQIGLMALNIVADNSVDFSKISQVIVETEYDDPENQFRAEQSFLLTPDKRTDTWKLRLSNRHHRAFRWRAIYALKDNVEVTTDWVNSSETTVVVSNPYQGSRKLRLTPAVKAAEILEAIVDITYEEPNGYRLALQEVFTPDNIRGRTLTLDTISPNPGPYHYAITIVRANGSVYSSDEVESDLGAVVVDDKDGRVVALNIKLLGEPFRWEPLYALELQLWTEDELIDSLLFTQSQAQDRTYLLGLPEETPLRYQWRTVSYLRNGTRQESPFQLEQDTNVLVPLG